MVTGIIILDSGQVQIIGNPPTLKVLIQHMREAIPQLMQEEQKLMLQQFSTDELSQLLELKRQNDSNRTEQ